MGYHLNAIPPWQKPQSKMSKKRHIKLKLSKSLQFALKCENVEGGLLQRLTSIEQRLSRVERALEANTGVCEDIELFFTDADHSASQSQQELYRSWLSHYENEPAAIEPGRTAHEMAALAASKFSEEDMKIK